MTEDPVAGARAGRGRKASWRRLLLLALLAEGALLAGLVHDEITWSGNESTRLATVERLLESGTFAIDGSPIQTVDRVRIGGRFYSDKPLLLTVWLATVAWPLHRALDLSFAADGNLIVWMLTCLGVTSFSLLLTALFAARLRRSGAGAGVALALGVAAVLTTWVVTFGTTINNHTPAAALVFALLLLLEREQEQRRPAGLGLPFAAGLLAATVAAIEIPTGAVFAAAAAGVLAARRRRRALPALLAFAGGAALVALAVAAIDLVAYGHALPAYLVPGAFDFPGNIHTTAAAGLHRPESVPRYLFALTFGERGVFLHQPALLLAFAFLWSERRRLGSVEIASALAVCVLVAFYATRTGDLGGWAYGFRFLVPVIPVLFWWASRWMLAGGRVRRLAFAGLAVAGLATSWIGTWNPWPVVYEGAATAPGAVEHHVRSPLLANVLVRGFERGADGAAFRLLFEHYGRRVSLGYLHKALVNLRREHLLPRLVALARDTRPSAPPPSPPPR